MKPILARKEFVDAIKAAIPELPEYLYHLRLSFPAQNGRRVLLEVDVGDTDDPRTTTKLLRRRYWLTQDGQPVQTHHFYRLFAKEFPWMDKLEVPFFGDIEVNPPDGLLAFDMRIVPHTPDGRLHLDAAFSLELLEEEEMPRT